MRKRTRRWSGTFARSKSAAATGSPDSVASRRASTSSSGPSSGPIPRSASARPVGGRHQVAPHLLRQRAHQRGDQVEAVPGHLPVEAVGADLVEHGQRHVHGHAVVGGARTERVGHVERQDALAPRGGEGVEVEAVGVGGQVGAGEGQQLGLGSLRLLPPPVEVAGRHHLLGDALIEERCQPLAGDEQVAAAGALLQLLAARRRAPGWPRRTRGGCASRRRPGRAR